MERMLTVPEVAAVLRKAPFTVRKRARLGQLPGAKKVGRDWLFNAEKIERFSGGKGATR